LGSRNTAVTPVQCNRTTMRNEAELNVVAEDIDIHCGGAGDIGAFKARKEETNLNFDESDEKPRVPTFSRSLSASIPTPPPPPPMLISHSLFMAPNIVTPDPGIRCGLLDSSTTYGFGVTAEKIQRQGKRLTSRISCPNSVYY
jgi:hypothetical protein